MSEKTIRICDGCGKTLKRMRECFHLVLRTDVFDGGMDIGNYDWYKLDFCEFCALDIKKSLQKIALRLQQNEDNSVVGLDKRNIKN